MKILGIEYVISGTNCCIKDSYKVTDKVLMNKFVNSLIIVYPEFAARSKKSYVREWRAHNWLYEHKLFRASTKDTDLNIYESLIRRVGYYFLSLLY